jgi:diguanylate cyclase (GGDEF)-like protein
LGDSSALGQQLVLLLIEALMIAVALFGLFRARSLFGLVPIYTTIAILYQLANLLAATVYIRISPEILISPGSVVLFPALLLTVLFVYIREDAQEARKLIYALLAGDLVVAALGLLITRHFDSPLLFNPHNLTPDLFLQEPRILVVGTLALYLDTILIILLYELVSLHVSRSLVVRVVGSMVVILLFDTLFFVVGSFVESPQFISILLSALVGKSVVGLIYGLLLAAYLRWFDQIDYQSAGARSTLSDLFELLTYRQKYEVLRAQMTRDGLTGVYNRAFFDEMCDMLLARARRNDSPMTMMMIDLDHFKQINDSFGHRAGDEVLRAAASIIASTSRASDLVCRYGGEEFGVLLPDTDLAQGIRLAERIDRELPTSLAHKDANWGGRSVTATIGLASFPLEVDTSEELIQLADQRLYVGKARGRSCVVPNTDELEAALAAPKDLP